MYACLGNERPEIKRSWPEPIQTLLTRCWDKNKHNRYTFATILTELTNLQQSEGGSSSAHTTDDTGRGPWVGDGQGVGLQSGFLTSDARELGHTIGIHSATHSLASPTAPSASPTGLMTPFEIWYSSKAAIWVLAVSVIAVIVSLVFIILSQGDNLVADSFLMVGVTLVYFTVIIQRHRVRAMFDWLKRCFSKDSSENTQANYTPTHTLYNNNIRLKSLSSAALVLSGEGEGEPQDPTSSNIRIYGYGTDHPDPDPDSDGVDMHAVSTDEFFSLSTTNTINKNQGIQFCDTQIDGHKQQSFIKRRAGSTSNSSADDNTITGVLTNGHNSDPYSQSMGSNQIYNPLTPSLSNKDLNGHKYV